MEPRKNFMNTQEMKLRNYTVDDDVPMPVKRLTRKSKYPFGTMLCNQSVEITDKKYGSIIGVLRKHKKEGKKFAVRKSEAGYRVWRLE